MANGSKQESVMLLLAVLAVAAAGASAADEHAPPSLSVLADQGAAAAGLCDGKLTACVDARTLAVCAAGYAPVVTLQCAGTRLCYDGMCLAEPPSPTPSPKPSPTPSTTPQSDTASSPATTQDTTDAHGESACDGCYSRTVFARLDGRTVAVANETCGADAPYCAGGECSADPPANSSCRPPPTAQSDFRCYGSGYFPDPANCTRYHLCVGQTAYDFDCGALGSRLIYNHARALCVPAKSADECFTFDCRGRVGQYLTYGPDQTVYASCQSEYSADALVSSCPPAQRIQQVFDEDNRVAVQCTPFCPRAGRFPAPDVDDEKRAFLECFEGSRGLVGPLEGVCPSGTTFDTTTERCTVATVHA